MEYPTLNVKQKYRQMTDDFRGYNHNLRIGDGEFYDMKNMTSDYYPILSPRGNRGEYVSVASPQGLIGKDSLCYVDGTEFVMNEYRIDMGLSTAEEDCPKQLVSMGAYVIILPDKKYINTMDVSDYGNIETAFTTNGDVSFSLCKADGSAYSAEFIQAEAPKEPANMTLWIDTSSVPHTLKQWAETSGTWVSIATTYVKITSIGIGAGFSQYDGIDISGLSEIEDAGELADLEGAATVWDKGDDYIVVTGILDTARTISNQITIARKMPNMDFVVEAKNRLWGCRYGVATNGEVVNEIYASKLGDFKNWNSFLGLSTDSWVGSVGTDGQFTGAVTYLGYPLFFKENVLHKVYISDIGAHGIQDTACRGVQKGSHKSLAIVNETLYYKARSGICAYDGSLPVEASYQLGNDHYSDAVGGANGNKYYISMKDSMGESHLFVHDTAKGMWHKEDGLRVDAFCSCRGEMYAISGGKIITMLGSGVKDEAPIEWMAQTGPIGTDMPDMKYISRLTIRMSMALGTRVRFLAQYDSMGEWEQICYITGMNLRSFSVPIQPRRCDHFRLRIEGVGDARIYSITKTIEQGSETS